MQTQCKYKDKDKDKDAGPLLLSFTTQCLEFTQALVNQKIGFNIQLTSGSFSFSFDNIGKRTIAPTRTPTEVKRKSPSTIRRNARRRRKFLENKKYQSSSVGSEKPDHVESSQSYSESTSVPSSVSTDIIYNDPGDGFTKESEGVQKVPPLKILVNNPSSPIYRIQQVDGACCLSDEDEDGELSLCDKNQSSEHGDDPKTVLTVTSPLAFYINAKIMKTKQTLTQLTQLRVTARSQELKECQTTLKR